MAPLKGDIESGLTYNTPVAIAQQCFRAKVPPQYLHGFEMLGLLAPGAELSGVMRDTLHILETVCGFERSALRIVLDASDVDLCGSARAILPGAQLIYKTGNDGDYSTRWTFGSNVEKVGRGLTFTFQSATDEQMTPLGNVIVIEPKDGRGQSFVEFGFGVEALCSARSGGSIWKVQPYRALTEGLVVSLGVVHEKAQALVKLWLAALCLVEHDVSPGAKGSAYVMRKLTRNLGVQAWETPEGKSMTKQFLAVHATLAEIYIAHKPAAAGLLDSLRLASLTELCDFEASIESKRQAFVRKGIGRLSETSARRQLKECHGLPDRTIEDILTCLREKKA
jgi:hypothetical protein